jgi:membrane fusion protein (multidrug efflux system)
MIDLMQTQCRSLLNKRLSLPLLCVLTQLVGVAADAPKPLDVKIARPSRGDIVRYVTLPGSIRANQQATLYAKVPGYLKSIAVDKGDKVQAGQALGEIEVPELLADLTKYQAELKVAEIDASRLNSARDKAPDLVTPQSVDDAKGKFEIAKANIERVETLLRYSKLTAPFSGVVTMRYVDAGAFIPAATGGSAASAAVLTVMDFQTVRAQVGVPELEAPLVRVGQPVKVSVEGLPGKVFEGQVTRQSFALDDASKTMLVEADLPNADLTLRPGMYAMIKVGVEKHTNALLIPAEALVMEKANAFTFVADGGKARKTAVKIGFNDGAKVEVLNGLTENESVILVGKMALADKHAVNVVEAK